MKYVPLQGAGVGQLKAHWLVQGGRTFSCKGTYAIIFFRMFVTKWK